MVTLHLKTSSNSHGSWGKSLWPTFVFSTSAHFANFYYSCEDFIHMRISRELSDQKCDRWYSLCGIKIIFKVILKIATLLKKKSNESITLSLIRNFGPGWCGSVGWVPACELKGHKFNSQSGHMSGLWARFPVGGAWEATSRCFSPSFSLSPPFLKINK